jgi:flagellin FlaB
MLASKFRRMLRRNDRGEVGVGTLIIFIAMVLVAAVAAAVIIGTSGSLQQRAQQTGKEATADVSSNLRIVDVYGSRTLTTDDIETITFSITPASGAVPMDLTQTVIRYSDGNNVYIYKFGDATLPFDLFWVRGEGTNNVVTSGDLVEITVELDTPLPPRTQFTMQLLHEVGAPAELILKTPSTYSEDLQIKLG